MSKFIIIVLLAALAAAAYFTKPDEPKKSFTDFLVKKLTVSDNGVVKDKWQAVEAEDYADSCEYQDHIFWVSVKKPARNGEAKTVYVGAFAHWFNKDDVNKEVKTVEHKAAKDIDEWKKDASTVQDLSSHVGSK